MSVGGGFGEFYKQIKSPIIFSQSPASESMQFIAHGTGKDGRVNVTADGNAWVYVDQSSVLDDGELGLFAARTFKPKTTLGMYTGDVVTDGLSSPYCAYICTRGGFQGIVDGRDAGPPYLQRINDARGTNQRKNCRMLQSGRIVTLKTIQPGQELFMSYGRGYWRLYRPFQAPT